MVFTLNKKPFTVFVDDNFHYQDASERFEHGSYATYEEAIAACKLIVDEYFPVENKEGKSFDELFEGYTSFGEDPFIDPVPSENERFSAWKYAKKRCKEIYAASNG